MKAKLLSLILLFNFTSLFAQQDTTEIDIEQIKNMNGKQIYEYFCAKCHGIDGRGNIPEEIKQNWDVPPPDFTDPYFNTREPRKDWYTVIKYGGARLGLSRTMPAFGDAFTDEQIYDVIEHIKSFVDQSKYPQGELNFIRAHYATKAYVEQEFLLIPTYTYKTENGHNINDTKVVLYYANRFGSRFQYEVKLPIQNLHSCVQNTTGIGDLELGLKYAFYDNYKNLSILTAGFEFSIPTGSEAKGFGKGTVVLVPYIAGAKEFWKIQLQGSAKIETPINKSKGNPELVYAISTTLVLPEDRRGIYPGIELVGTKNLGAEQHRISIVPKLYIALTKRGHLAISLGREIPIYGGNPFKYRYVGFILWDYVDGGIFSGW